MGSKELRYDGNPLGCLAHVRKAYGQAVHGSGSKRVKRARAFVELEWPKKREREGESARERTALSEKIAVIM